MPGREFERELKQALQEYRRGNKEAVLEFMDKYGMTPKEFLMTVACLASRENLRDRERRMTIL